MECQIVDLFGWSPPEIDESDIDSLIPLVFEYPLWKAKQKTRSGRRQVYADQVDWL